MERAAKLCLILIALCSVAMVTASEETRYKIDSNDSSNGTEDHEEEEHEGVILAEWNIDYVREPLIITLFVLVAAIAKIGFHHAGVLSSIFPESCLLIVLGTLIGVIFLFVGNGQVIMFSSRTFFLFLLPPAVLESAFSLHDRTFFNNFGTIVLYAVVGTILSCFLIGPSLYGISQAGLLSGDNSLSLVECLTFSALIVAVDPVAVLAIFQEINVNHVLYFLVFGESLLNDAVTVVLYRMMVAFLSLPTVPPSQIGLGILAFFVVTLGSLTIGIFCGVVSALFTKLTTHVRVVEPLAIIGVAYLSYLLAELFEFSGIIALIACGLMQANYSFANISHKSRTTVKYFMKMLASTTDAIIFFFLGKVLVTEKHIWDTWFVIFTLLFCFVYRYVVVISLTFLVNRYKYARKINWEEQFIMGYGGLRGAVCFSLVILLDEDQLRLKRMLVTTTLAVIIFTVFVQGISIKPLVKVMRIHLAESHKPSMFEEMTANSTDYLMAGVEEIVGHKGENYFRVWLEHLDDTYFKKWLQKEPQTLDVQILLRYEKISIQEHLASVQAVVHGMKGAVDDLHRVESNLRKEVPADDYLHATHNGETKQEDINQVPDAEDVKKLLRQHPTLKMRNHKFDRNAMHDDSHDLQHYLRHRSRQIQRQMVISRAIAKKRESRLLALTEMESPPSDQGDDAVPAIQGDDAPPSGVSDGVVNIVMEEIEKDDEKPAEIVPLVVVDGEVKDSESKF